ncbi:hypothetical protein [Thalassomonas haliotis]|uniref:Methyl-accepting chemotaxis protein n=1 Tax=Thalassomonas haliotis TaxID=485448 RepID=A0ABY7V7K9_9GAMM|nr:hypothetical protein [Thalassomonas haliotis]WDE09611.1 hypothetical protein H3N35_14845 [Thalassomonas haliotis]
MSEATEDNKTGILEQSQGIRMVATSVTEISVSVNEVKRHAKDATKVAGQAMEEIHSLADKAKWHSRLKK